SAYPNFSDRDNYLYSDSDNYYSQEMTESSSYAFKNLHHGIAGAIHGSVNFFSDTAFGLASIACSVGTGEIDDSWNKRQENFDNLIASALCVDRTNSVYQSCRGFTTTTLEVGSFTVGGYQAVRTGIKWIRLAELSNCATKTTGKIAAKQLNY